MRAAVIVMGAIILLMWLMYLYSVYEEERQQEQMRLASRPKPKPFCRYKSDPRLPNSGCVRPPLRKDGKLDSDPELAAAQARWLLSEEHELAMLEWEAQFWKYKEPRPFPENLTFEEAVHYVANERRKMVGLDEIPY